MKACRLGGWSVVVMTLMLALSGSAWAQAQPGGQQGGRGQGRQRGNGGNFDPAAMRERYMAQLKEQLGSPDEEWKLLQPKVEKLLTLRRDSRGGGGFTGRNRGGRTRGGDNNNNQAQNTPQSAVAAAQQDLRKAIEDKSTPPEELTKKIAALRDAKEKAKADLAAAQKDLRDLLSARQEAILISNGMLD